MRRSGVSTATWALLVFGLFATAGVFALIVLGVGGDDGATLVSDVGETVIVAVATLACFAAAVRFEPGEPLRRNWMLIAIGLFFFTLGDAAWTYYEVVRGIDVPFPGLPDAFYLLEYPFAALGVILAAVAYRRLFDVIQPFAISVLVTGMLLVGGWFLLLEEILLDRETVLVERALSAAYPVADLVLLFGPALFIVLVVGRLGGGRIAWPWRIIAFAYVLLAVTDAGFAWLDWNELYAGGSVVDAGWMLGYTLIGVAASLARDVHAPRTVPVDRQPGSV